MQTGFTPAERKVVNLWLDTEVGERLLELLEESKQTYLSEAMTNTSKGVQFTHDKVVAAQTVDYLIAWLKPPEKKKEETD